MRTNLSMPAAQIIPILEYPEFPSAVKWLEEAFGFAVRLRIGAHRAQLQFEGGAIVVSEANSPGRFPRNRTFGDGPGRGDRRTLGASASAWRSGCSGPRGLSLWRAPVFLPRSGRSFMDVFRDGSKRRPGGMGRRTDAEPPDLTRNGARRGSHRLRAADALAPPQAGRVEQHLPRPAVDVALSNKVSHLPHPLALDACVHPQRQVDRFSHSVRIVGIDDQRFRKLARGPGEAREDKHPLFVVAGGDELLGDETGRAIERYCGRYSGPRRRSKSRVGLNFLSKGRPNGRFEPKFLPVHSSHFSELYATIPPFQRSEAHYGTNPRTPSAAQRSDQGRAEEAHLRAAARRLGL